MDSGALPGRFPRERTWLLPALHAVQHAERWLSPAALDAVAEHLRVPRSEVWGVASHYPEFRLAEPGATVVRVCTGLACLARGGGELLASAERRLGVLAGATTADGVTLEAMDCAFACAMAPVAVVERCVHGRVMAEALAALPSAALSRATGATDGDAPAAATPAASPSAAAVASPSAPPAAVPSVSPVAAPSGSSAAAPTASPAAAPRRSTTAAADVTASDRLAGLVRSRATAGRPRLGVALGTCGLSVDAGATLHALGDAVARRNAPFDVVATGCAGLCWAAPAVTVLDGEHATVVPRVGPDDVGRLLDDLAHGRAPATADECAEYLVAQRRLVMADCGVIRPADLGDALARGRYAALARALDAGRPEDVIEAVKRAGLAGRGGAYFPTAVKWAACRQAPGDPKYLVVNAEEGEPGIFKDRHLLEGDPHRLLEGALLAAFATGASRGILYIHGEADVAADTLTAAVAQARAAGLLGEAVLGTSLAFDVEIRRGAGGFVLGEETALLESLEGRRAMPRTRPPFPAQAGLHGKPTVINNVETLAAVVSILEMGPAAFAALGRGGGTKLFGLSGHVRRPGVVELEAGSTLETLLARIGGGAPTDEPIASAVLGGPSGSVVPPRLFAEPLVPRGPVNPGTGGVVALGARFPVREAVRTLLGFNARESCGKCTPCREGTARLLAMLDEPLDEPRVKELAEVIQVASLCGLGQAAPLSVLSALAEFPEAFARPRVESAP